MDTPRPCRQGLLVQASARQLDRVVSAEVDSAAACVVAVAATVEDSTEADSVVATAAALEEVEVDTSPTAGAEALPKAHLLVLAEGRVGLALVGMEAVTEDTAAAVGLTTEIAVLAAATASPWARDANTADTVTVIAMVGMAGTETTILASAATKEATATATRGANAATKGRAPTNQANTQTSPNKAYLYLLNQRGVVDQVGQPPVLLSVSPPPRHGHTGIVWGFLSGTGLLQKRLPHFPPPSSSSLSLSLSLFA